MRGEQVLVHKLEVQSQSGTAHMLDTTMSHNGTICRMSSRTTESLAHLTGSGALGTMQLVQPGGFADLRMPAKPVENLGLCHNGPHICQAVQLQVDFRVRRQRARF